MQTVLLVSARAEDRRGLQSVLSGTEWALAQVADSAAAVDSLKRTGFPIVLCDRDLAGGEWQDTLRLLHSVRDRPCVILLSNVADEYLWNEVVRRGGFDVLTRPFRKEQVVSMLEFAYTYWKTAWPVPKS